jgi:enamine deaminase RidA (YjgF/YER057c/UK114 family)
VDGDRVYVSGTAPVMPDDADPPDDPYEQSRRCLEILQQALDEAGASAAGVVRTRVFVTDRAHMDEVMRAHGEVFGEVRPACTGIVTQLIDPRWLVEIEVEAILRP